MYKLTALTKLILAIMISIASLITNDLYISRIKGMLCINKSCDTSAFLYLATICTLR